VLDGEELQSRSLLATGNDVKPPAHVSMPVDYDLVFDRLLADSAAAGREPTAEVTPFWPIVGWKYDGSLMVIGRSVNGWIENWPVGELVDPVVRKQVVRTMRADAEREDRCRMLWVTDLAGKTAHRYNTNRSAFWRVLRSLTLQLTDAEPADWPSNLAWTNLYKLAPAAGWNPGADLQRAQREAAAALLAAEVEALKPARLIALTGRWWIAPIADSLGMSIDWRDGLVEGVGTYGATKVVVARHPMGKPRDRLVAEVLAAFG
jgi:hypothetical protein